MSVQGCQLLIGVSGGVAAYKTAALVSALVQREASVTVAMTEPATRFVGPATFEALSGKPVLREIFDPRYPLGTHIEAAREHQLLCIAPCTADCLAKLARGAADDVLSAIYLCFTGPVLVAPAMNTEMWSKPAVQRNVSQLRDDGVQVVGPEAGWLSCRQQGAGRMASPEQLALAIGECLEQAD